MTDPAPLTEEELAEMSNELFPAPVTLEQVQWWEKHHRGPYGHVDRALIHKLARSWLEQNADLRAARAEVERLKAFMGAVLDHGMTTWSDTSCGRGGVGGQMMTTTAHPEVIQHLALSALHGTPLAEAADQYAAMAPNTARLDEPARPPRRAGPDGRPR